MSSADELKAQGNAAFAAKDYPKAVELFSKAIEASEQPNHVLFSNRSGSYASIKDYANALADANECIKINSKWPKGYSRKGAALFGEGDLVGAKDAYEEALKLDPANAQAKSGLKSVDDAISREASQDGTTPDMGFNSMFGQDMWGKLAANPKSAPLLADQSFVQRLQEVQKNPNLIQTYMSTDPRFMTVISVLLGLNFEMPPNAGASADSKKEEQPQQKKPAEPEPEPEPETEEAIAQRKALEEKAEGNKLYKARKFDEAIEHYNKAWELDENITYLNNRAAAEFEKGDYDTCIKTCEEAVEKGREKRADYKLIAKAFGRIGSAYQKKEDLDKAIEFYSKSLTEHRTPDVLAKLRAVEKEQKTRSANAYIDPVKAEEAREEGGKLFKEADWPGAVKAYTEMIARAPEDPRGYSNRAAALSKLLSFPEAVKDCNVAISKDPTFIRAYIRKANALFTMREYSQVIETLSEATKQDTEHKFTGEIDALNYKALNARFQPQEGETEQQTLERASKDPEIVSILQDPVMNSILSQARDNPAALNDHLKNPEVRHKIQLLTAAGIIRMR